MSDVERSFTIIQQNVHVKAPRPIIQDMLDHLKEFPNTNLQILMGTYKERKSFKEEYVYLCLYKFMYNIGYNSLWNSVKKNKNSQGWLPEVESTMRKNIQRMSFYLTNWSRKYIYNRTKDEWKESANEEGLIEDLKGVLLIIDSFDIKLCRNNVKPSEEEWWSSKIDHRAARYTYIQDFSGWTNYLSKAYSPKVYSSDWVGVNKEMLIQNYKGISFLADQHYHTSTSMTNSNVIFQIPFKNEQIRETGKCFTKNEEEWNNKIAKYRDRIETLQSYVQHKFRCLEVPWQEDIEIQENIVTIAIGMKNYSYGLE